MSAFGTEEGAVCWRDGCQGVIALKPTENCSCHIAPPCSGCVEAPLWCAACKWEDEPNVEAFNDYIVKSVPGQEAWAWCKPRPLDPRKIDWRSKPHSNSSMIKEGVYPEGMTAIEVAKVVRGTFGGRFESFGNGRFKYIAYTD